MLFLRLLTASGPRGSKRLWLSKLDVLGARLSGAGLKSWGATCELPSLPSSGRKGLQVASSLLRVGG